MLVLVGDAQQEYGEVIEELLRCQSHRVVLAASQESFRRFLERSSVDFIVLSSSIAGGAPAQLLEEIRRMQAAPIIVTVEHDERLDVAACFAAGADDCVRKPFHPSEFAARIDAISRRAPAAEEPIDQPGEDLAPSENGLQFDPRMHRVYYNGTDLRCSQLEYQILREMSEMDGQVLPYAYLNQRVWGYPRLMDGTLLKGHISSIRSKLRAVGMKGQIIRTVNGVGYALSHSSNESEVVARGA